MDEDYMVHQVSMKQSAGGFNLVSAEKFLSDYSLNDRMKMIFGQKISFFNHLGNPIPISKAKFPKK